jgi:hypothetical protein
MIRSQNGQLSIPSRYILPSAKVVFASEIVFAASLGLVKISILLGYHELFFVLVWIKRFIWFMVVVCVLLLVMNTVGLFVICSPVEENYGPGANGRCLLSRSSGASLSTIINIVVDIVLVVIPSCVVWTLKINMLRKIGVSIMFGLGLLYVKSKTHLQN